MVKYTHLSQRNQILKRPAQHVGSKKTTIKKVWISQIDGKEEAEKIMEQDISFNAGLIHIFYEALSNAQDNYFVSLNTDNPLKKIEVSVSLESGEISVWNDGQWIPNRIHMWEKDEEKIDDKDHYEA